MIINFHVHINHNVINYLDYYIDKKTRLSKKEITNNEKIKVLLKK